MPKDARTLSDLRMEALYDQSQGSSELEARRSGALGQEDLYLSPAYSNGLSFYLFPKERTGIP
jgi:hypothetical protein